MSGAEVVDLANKTIWLSLLLSAPPLVVGLVVGLLVAIFQATTQIQEMTLTFVPKIFAVMVAMIFFASWMLLKLTNFTSNLILQIPDLIR
ncbi:MAG TPA: flagellar biosynthesis protein FliQ [Desulfobacterales bacterium]|nr:flagellar biosynthesis protein FliQ [Desulfobacterales bacterium]